MNQDPTAGQEGDGLFGMDDFANSKPTKNAVDKVEDSDARAKKVTNMFDDGGMDYEPPAAVGDANKKKSKVLSSMFSGGDISTEAPAKKEEKKVEKKEEVKKPLPGIGKEADKDKKKKEEKKIEVKKKDDKKKKDEPIPKKLEMPKGKPAPKKEMMSFDDEDDSMSLAFDNKPPAKDEKPMPSLAAGRKPSVAAKATTKK